MQEQRGRTMGNTISMHALEKAEIINVLCDIREKLRYMLTTFTVLFELPRRLEHTMFRNLFGLGENTRIIERSLFTVMFFQQRLVVKSINMARPPLHEHEDHTLRACRKMPRLGCKWIITTRVNLTLGH